jgi:hypothetical protein
VVCFNDTEEPKPEGSDKSEGSTEAEQLRLLLKAKQQLDQLSSNCSAATYAQGHHSQLQRKIFSEKI